MADALVLGTSVFTACRFESCDRHSTLVKWFSSETEAAGRHCRVRFSTFMPLAAQSVEKTVLLSIIDT